MRNTRKQYEEAVRMYELRFRVRCSREFLRLARLSEGDEVTATFHHTKSTPSKSHAVSTKTKGVIRKGKDNIYFVESVEPLEFAKLQETPNGPRWKPYMEKGKTALDKVVLSDDE